MAIITIAAINLRRAQLKTVWIRLLSHDDSFSEYQQKHEIHGQSRPYLRDMFTVSASWETLGRTLTVTISKVPQLFCFSVVLRDTDACVR